MNIESVHEKLKDVEQQLHYLNDEIRNLKDNHLHTLDLRLTKLETSISVGWKAVIFGAGIPAVISAVLSAIQLLK